jgi:NAD(P)-dependent dehydrogenase (short-subunit alcohol dehydrogenase family)
MRKTAIVTGAGHFTSIGSQTALDLLYQGNNVAIISRSIDSKWQTYKNQFNDQLLIFFGDITVADVQQNFLNSVLINFDRLDFLVHNASSGLPKYNTNGLVSRESWNENFDVSVVAVYDFSNLCKPYLSQNKGAIVNVSSRAAIMNNVGNNIAYSVSKAALLKLTEQMAIDFAPNVTVNAVSPGFVHTARLEKVFGSNFEKIKQERLKNTLTKEEITVQDVSSTIINLLNSRFINGQNISICGGTSLSINTAL